MNGINLNKLISHMETLRPDQFDIRYVFRGSDGQDAGSVMPNMALSGTAACIAGECAIASGCKPGSWWSTEDAGAWLELPPDEWHQLSEPEDFDSERHSYSLPHALKVLYHFRLTGKIDWKISDA